MLTSLLPSDLDPWLALALIALSFATSFITAMLSLGGGTLMLAVLALVFPPAVVVPIHGCVQLGSNGGRAFVQRAHIQWRLVLWISLGAVIGTVIGGKFADVLPEIWFQVAIGGFILVSTWLPQPRIAGSSRTVQFIGGLVISAIGMVVGATGALIITFIKGLADRRQLVGTHATLMTIQNGFKVITFTALGFAFATYLPLILAMVVTGFLGTTVGSRLLVHVPERIFRFGFKLVLSVIALELIREALF